MKFYCNDPDNFFNFLFYLAYTDRNSIIFLANWTISESTNKMIKKGIVRGKKEIVSLCKKLNLAADIVLIDGHTLISSFALCKIWLWRIKSSEISF